MIVLLQIRFVIDRLAIGALVPQAFRHIAFFTARFKGSSFKNTHDLNDLFFAGIYRRKRTEFHFTLGRR